MQVGHVVGLSRYPVKSMAGEPLDEAVVTRRGLVGDRLWAVYTEDGGIGSGKNTRRFRKVEGLLELSARSGRQRQAPRISFPDGRELSVDDPEAAHALTAMLGRPLRLAAEADVGHHDECGVHVLTTAGLRAVEQLVGEPVPAARFRGNILLETPGVGFVEDDWLGRRIAVGTDVVLRLEAGMPRCVMVDLAQPHDGVDSGRVLTALGRAHDVEFGLVAHVERTGTVGKGDAAVLLD